MPLKLFKRKTHNGYIWHYRGTVAGDRLRGTTGTADRKIAARLVSEIEHRRYKRRLDGPQEVLTFPQAVTLYLRADKSDEYLGKIEDHWKDALVKDMTAGAIKQSAIDLYPGCSGATWNRQVITPTQAVINHCASLELCAPIRIKRFEFDAAVKTPVDQGWLDTFLMHARPMIKALVLVMFATACRFCEAHRLKWKTDIDFKRRTIRIKDTKTKKTRVAHMPQPVLVALANLPRERAPYTQGDEYLERPFYLSESTLRRHWDEDVATTAEAVPGFERLTFHCCRHGFATTMLRKGIDAKTAAEKGGWDDMALFMKTYAHAMTDPTLTDVLFDTPLTRGKSSPQQKQKVRRNR
jgi:hypothetical protein